VISQTSEYALRAVVYIASIGGGPAVAQDIADATRVPHGYLSKILRQLARAGILAAQRGIGGGFMLARQPQDISITDILRAVDAGMERIRKCPLGIDSHKNLCELHHTIDQVIATVEESFSKVTIARILASKRKSKPLCDARYNHHRANLTLSAPKRKR